MSFDPFHQQQPPPEPTPPPGLLPASGAPAPLSPTPLPPAGAVPVPLPDTVRERVLFPAVLLILTGVLNLLFAAVLGSGAVFYGSLDPEEFERLTQETDPKRAKQLEAFQQQGYTMEGMLRITTVFFAGSAGLNLLTFLVGVVAGILLLQLRGYGFVLFASLMAAVPCVSGSGCCCLGQVAGFWSLFLLLQPDVRAAFR